VVAALALTGCGNGGSPGIDRGTAGGGGSAGSGGTAGNGGAGGSGGTAGSGGAGGSGGTAASGGIAGSGGTAGAAGGGGTIGGTTLSAQGFQAYCMKMGECYPETYESCIADLPYVELWAQSLTGECDALIGSYFECLGQLTCEQLMGYDDYSCYDEGLADCQTTIP
jgi:hypothetical protein